MGDNRICGRDAQRTAQRVVLVAVVLVAGAAAVLAQPRAPVPDAAAQKGAQELLRDVYGKEYDAAKTSAEKTELAKKLLDQAAKSKGDPASHFVLLRVAKEMAILAADAETALGAVERIVTTYDVDAMEMRLDCVKGLAAAAKFSSQHGALAEQAYSLVDVGLAEDDFEAASQFGEIARASAQRARNYSLLKEVVAQMEKLGELQQAHAEYQKAVARLEESPTDPEANLAAGRYLCLSRGDWERGIPMLALGSDPALKGPAVQELTGADSPDAQIALGDAWWDLAQTREGRERDCFLLRAGHWYEEAQPKVTAGLVRVKLEKRLGQIANVDLPAAEVPSSHQRPGSQPDPAVAPFDAQQAMVFQQAWSRHLKTPVFLTNSIGMKLVLIPPGEFDMGSTPEELDLLRTVAAGARLPDWMVNRAAAETPRHRVRITKPFYLGVSEVTKAEYALVTGTGLQPLAPSAGGSPVGGVSWDEAQEFCRRLSDLPTEKEGGRVYHLPSEAQWEYACRAGAETSSDARKVESWLQTNPVLMVQLLKQDRPNAWGLYKMHGSLWEWCSDWFGEGYYAQSPRDDPSGPPSGSGRVNRGGGACFWYSYRGQRPQGTHDKRFGFRAAMTLAQ